MDRNAEVYSLNPVLAQFGQHSGAGSAQTTGPFQHTNGAHPDVSSVSPGFADAVNFSGGARQGSALSTAPGVARPGVIDPTTYALAPQMQTQGSGHTFRESQAQRKGGR